VLHAMQRDPADRFQTAAAFKAQLDQPGRVRLTGYCDRLKTPHWRLSFRETPVIAGTLLGVGSSCSKCWHSSLSVISWQSNLVKLRRQLAARLALNRETGVCRWT